MKRKIAWLLVSCLMVATLVLASCGPAVTEEEEVVTEEEEEVAEEEEEEGPPVVEVPKYGGTLTQVMSYGPLRFDETFGHHYMAPSLYLTNEDLLQGDWAKGPAGTNEDDWLHYSKIAMPDVITGCIAESYEFLDPNTLVFHIRKGVHWHDKPPTNGRELTADDVVFSLLRVYEYPTSFQYGNAPWDDCFESIEATDKWTVVIKYKNRADAYAQEGDHNHIFARDAVEFYGDMSDWKNAIGTGAFELIDYVVGSSLTFKRFDNYWMKDPIGPGKGNQLPYVDNVKWLIIPDASTRIAALRTGKIDHLGLGWEQAAEITATNPEIKQVKYYGGGTTALYFKVNNPELPAYDQRVRQALAMAIDNEAIADLYYGGNAEVFCWPAASVKFLKEVYRPLEEMPEVIQQMFGYYPDEAKQLLADAGYPNGFKTEIVCIAGYADLLSIIKDYWEDIGVELTLDVKEYGAWSAIMSNQTHKYMFVRGVSTTLPKDLNPVLIGNWENVGGIEDQRIVDDKYRMDNAIILDEPLANEIAREIIPYILEKGWIIPLPEAAAYHFWQPWVKNYHGEITVGMADYNNWAKYVWIDRDMKEEMTGTR